MYSFHTLCVIPYESEVTNIYVYAYIHEIRQHHLFRHPATNLLLRLTIHSDSNRIFIHEIFVRTDLFY